jgi:predicted acylesterase/phospholipase RssA
MIATPPVTDPRSEVRIGLVLYGGVSLAVYMNGVVLEFWRLLRASRGITQNPYSELLRNAKVDVTVDVISGTSAGGINGVLLAKALATGADLSVLRNFWIDKADLDQLLRPPGETAPRSLLRSDFFENQLSEALAEMDRRGTKQTLVDVLDLFVSGTRLRGRVRDFIDGLGQTLQTREYRKMFQLRFRKKGFNPADRSLGYDRNDFEPKYNRTLVEICRATSAFPVAFEPRLIERSSYNNFLFLNDEPLTAYFSDGGILHNKPFTETLSTIFTRMADRPVKRWLFSVEPDPEHYAVETAPGPEPEFLEVLLKAVSGIPMYQSIAADFDRLDGHNAKVRNVIELLHGMESIISERFQTKVNEGTESEFRAFLEQQVLYFAYQALKRQALIGSLTDRFLRAAKLDESQREFVEAGIRSYRADEKTFLDTFDDGYRVRRAYYLLQTLDQFLDRVDVVAPEERERFKPAHQSLWAHFERIRALSWEVFEGNSESAKRVKGLYGQGGDALSAAVKDVLKDIGVALSAGLAGVRTDTLATCEEIESEIARLRGMNLPGVPFPPHPFPRIFDRYEIRDMFILPIEVLAEVAERDPIDFIRISPSAATYIEKRPEDKLAGDTLGHFGGFLSQHWRANDVLWGRLDSAEVIVRVLLGNESKQMVESHIHSIQEDITRAELPLVWQKTPNLNYKAHLEREHKVGEEELANLPAELKLPLALRASHVLRNMFRRVEQSDSRRGLKAAFRWLGFILSVLLSLIRWPAIALWSKDIMARKFATLVLFVFFLSGILLFVLASVLGVIPLDGRVGVWIGVLTVPFLLWIMILELRWRILAIVGLILVILSLWRRF